MPPLRPTDSWGGDPIPTGGPILLTSDGFRSERVTQLWLMRMEELTEGTPGENNVLSRKKS